MFINIDVIQGETAVVVEVQVNEDNINRNTMVEPTIFLSVVGKV